MVAVPIEEEEEEGCNQETQAVWHSEENCDARLLASGVELQTFRE